MQERVDDHYPLVRMERVKTYFLGQPGLKGVDFSVQRGEIFGVIGTSGAGKSTLIRCLATLQKPVEGKIYLEEIELTALSAVDVRRARKKMGMIFQHFNLFSSRTAGENVAYPLEIDGLPVDVRRARAHELLEMVGLQEKERHYPEQLSGGEKQRVAIARALARKPALLLCDEATSAVDPTTTQAILDLLLQLNKSLNLTIVLVTHEMEVIKQICTHVSVLEQGHIVEKGRTEDLFLHPKHPITKRFLQNIPHTIPSTLYKQQQCEDREIVRLSFLGKSAGEPIISRMIKQYDVEVNILLGSVDVLRHEEQVGNLLVVIRGQESERRKACQFLEANGVVWERTT